MILSIQEFSRLPKASFDPRMKEVDLRDKKSEKLQTFDSIYVLGKSHFEYNRTQNHLVFQPVFKLSANIDKVVVWKSKDLQEETIKTLPTSNKFFNPGINYTDNAKTWVEIDGSFLKFLKFFKLLYCLWNKCLVTYLET